MLKTVEIRVCDVCARKVSARQRQGTETLINYKGKVYKLDLCSMHFAQYSRFMDEFLGGIVSAPKAVAAKDKEEYADRVRQWGRDNGFKVSDRGRLSIAVVRAYEGAQLEAGE